jgi:hypothetical protein
MTVVRDTEGMGNVMASLTDLAGSSVFSKEGRLLFKDAADLIGELICLHASSIPVAEAVERILDGKSAWVASPNKEVAQAIALRAVVAAQQIGEEVKREWDAPWADKQFPNNIGRGDCTVFPPRDCSWPFCGCEKADGVAAMTPERMNELRRTAKERNCMVPVGLVTELMGEIDRLTKSGR